ncbi:hypothetical protein DEO72_LG8g1282 [Vigna unguiculata]|uniref:Uncharacterized protein n=1 Tax=Vigna unguiculata TaxID=3917 RepID=A0A4D6MQE3_VIGUN|nr:hypothetical protein DEO72_LG8g1282 [Vigna unguiculata]
MRRNSSSLLSIRKPPRPIKVFAPVTVSSSPSSSSQPIPEEPQPTQEEESRASPKAPASSELRVSPASRTSPVPRPSLAPTCATSTYSQTVGSTIESHAEAFTCIHQSLAELHLQQQRYYHEFEQFRDSQLLHQQHVEQLLHDTLALLRPHH